MLTMRCRKWLIVAQVAVAVLYLVSGLAVIFTNPTEACVNFICALIPLGVAKVLANPGREPNPLTNTSRASP